MGDVKKIWEENSNKNKIIKTLLESLNTIASFLYKPSDKNIDKSYGCGHSGGDKFKIAKNTAANDSLQRTKCQPHIINLNIDQDVVIANDVDDNGLSNNKKNRSSLKISSKATV